MWGRRKVEKKNQSQRDAKGEAEKWHELKERLAESFSECLSPHGVTGEGRGTEEAASLILNGLEYSE